MRIVVVGSGAGGATAARELALKGHDVLVLEAGRPFKPLSRRVRWVEPLRWTGVLGTERTIDKISSHIRTTRSSRDLVLVRGVTTGGTTTISCGNMVRAENGLKEIGLDLAQEFGEIEDMIGVMPIPRDRWRPTTQKMFDGAEKMGLRPSPTPKAVDVEKCVACGLCEVGCATGAKWDSRRFLADFIANGGKIQTESKVRKVIVEKNRAAGVLVARGQSSEVVHADAVILAAGGIGTAEILRSSDLPVSDTLWADIVLTMGGQLEGSRQLEEAPMVWYARRDDYIISPYIDILSHWFHKPWRGIPMENRVGVMVKLADAANGRVDTDGKVTKEVTSRDRERLDEGLSLARSIMETSGVKGPFVEGMLNGGHLGGTVPLGKGDVPPMRPSTLPEDLWVADLSLVLKSQGLPTMLTAAAIALRVARIVIERR